MPSTLRKCIRALTGLAAGIASLGLVSGCGTSRSDPAAALSGPRYQVTYIVSGQAKRVDITYQDSDGDTRSQVAGTLPWRHTEQITETVTDGHPGGLRLRLATLPTTSQMRGVMRCEILLSGRVVARRTGRTVVCQYHVRHRRGGRWPRPGVSGTATPRTV